MCNKILPFLFFSALYKALVVKASGLAAGKGVIVAKTKEEACAAARDILNVSIEEFNGALDSY